MRTLVTGIAGFVGRHLARSFAARPGEELFGADHLPPEAVRGDEGLAPYLGDYRVLDVTDAAQVLAWVRGLRPDRLVHLAAQASGADSLIEPAMTYRVNAVGALNVLEAVRTEAPETVVLLIGSADIYGSGAPGQKLAEDAPISPTNPYALSKAAQDALGDLYARTYGLNVVRTRTFSHTGPGQRPRFALAGFADQLARIDAGEIPPEIRVGNLDGVRDYGDVRDVVNAYALLLEQGAAGEAYNVCSGAGCRLRDLLDKLCAIAGVQPRVVQDPLRVRARDADCLVGDPAKLRARTGWAPEIPIERTLEDLYRDARERVRREIESEGRQR